jgi:hypothetical protein
MPPRLHAPCGVLLTKLMDRILSWAGHAVLLAALLLTRTLLGAEEVNLLLLGDWGGRSDEVGAREGTTAHCQGASCIGIRFNVEELALDFPVRGA